MKFKSILGLAMAAVITLSGATMLTNANFNATASSNGNAFTMGTVKLQRGAEQAAQSIQMDKLFNGTGMGLDEEKVTPASIKIAGDFPVVLSANIKSVSMPYNEQYNFTARKFEGPLTDAFAAINSDAKWWRQYKLAVTATVTPINGETRTITSRPIDVNEGYDSFFDTLNGEPNHEGIADTKGISQVLAELGTLQPGDVVTITTKMKLVSAFYDDHGVELTLTTDDKNKLQNYFQGQTLGANIEIVATATHR